MLLFFLKFDSKEQAQEILFDAIKTELIGRSDTEPVTTYRKKEKFANVTFVGQLTTIDADGNHQYLPGFHVNIMLHPVDDVQAILDELDAYLVYPTTPKTSVF